VNAGYVYHINVLYLICVLYGSLLDIYVYSQIGLHVLGNLNSKIQIPSGMLLLRLVWECCVAAN
jgi:hypothetical protein